MIRGTDTFRCPRCGHVFQAPDIEDQATARTRPMPCPVCGTPSPSKDEEDNDDIFSSFYGQ